MMMTTIKFILHQSITLMAAKMCSLTHWASCSVGWLPIIINYVNVSITLIDL